MQTGENYLRIASEIFLWLHDPMQSPFFFPPSVLTQALHVSSSLC